MVFVLWFREGKLLWPIFNKREQRFLRRIWQTVLQYFVKIKETLSLHSDTDLPVRKSYCLLRACLDSYSYIVYY